MKRIAAVILVGVFVLGFNSCILDPKEGTKPPTPKAPYKALDGERDNVLFNLQKAYVERNIEKYAELLDQGFLFHFSQTDIDNHVVDHSPWDRTEELSANRNMFNPNFTKEGVDPVSDIDLTLTYPAGDATWTLIPPEDHPAYPGETWYEKTVSYRLTVVAGAMTYNGNDIQASFVVRKATVEGYTNPIWRIVAWRDDTGTS
jgi:hypothetical protein